MQTSERPDTRPAPGAQKPLFFLGTESDPQPKPNTEVALQKFEVNVEIQVNVEM